MNELILSMEMGGKRISTENDNELTADETEEENAPGEAERIK